MLCIIFASQKNSEIMKKNKVVFGVLLALLSLASCQKNGSDNPQPLSPNRVIPIHTTDAKTAGQYWLSSEIGHDGKDCPGCVMYYGKIIHRDCMHHGNYCRFVARVTLDTVGTDISATTLDTFDLTSEDFFLMPDRSLSYTDENNNRIFLNIQEQLVFRDTATQQFTFTGLFFTTVPEYTND